ncbi:MAG: hypothetical protein L0K07_08970 [Yaniella sp.]|uniref:hypothetical protein n=2 Tax=Yaniella sp. TaxID=2773929 RepID=UPI002649D76E|nr:hypothetical protein [Yaniella sp.]MDN6357745.1 hypothetical protein [Yaniella sp.]MDN6411490.1 hypothetical protein [Yaniella sp.]MDN6678216.1 hypothetical protein [Yaniella sp.]
MRKIESESETSAVPGERMRKSAARVESRAIWVSISFAAVAVVIGLITFSGRLTPLSANYSVGTVAGVTAGIAAGASAMLGLIIATKPQQGSLRWMRHRFWGWWLVDFIGLIIIHGAIATLASLSTFRLFQQAFQGLVVDAIAATVMLCLACAAAAYFGFSSASRVSAASISTLLALFMAAGVLASMLLAENPYWWHRFFSELGTRQAGVLSFWTFNTTITVSGIVLTTLANFITQDLYTWTAHRRRQGKRQGFVRMLKGGMIVMGICMIGLSLVSIHINDPIHTSFVQILAVTFGILLLSAPLWLPGAPAAMYVISYLMLGLSILAAALWKPLGYYNLTALELAFAGIIFAWLVVLIRTVDGMIFDVTRQQHPDSQPENHEYTTTEGAAP